MICALLRDFRKHGEKAIAKVRREQPGVYLRCLTLLVPREHKAEHSNAIKDMTDEQIERSIELIQEILAQREAGANAKVIDGVPEPVPEGRHGAVLGNPSLEAAVGIVAEKP